MNKIDFKNMATVIGNHTYVAWRLGISPRHYRRIRSGKFTPSKELFDVMRYLSNDCKTKLSFSGDPC